MNTRPQNIIEQEWLNPTLNPNYWDCNCEGPSYIKPADEEACPDCGAQKDECPDSHAREVRAALIEGGVSLPINVHDSASREWVLCTESLVIKPAPEPADVPDAEDYHWYTLNGETRAVSMVRFDVEDFMGEEENANISEREWLSVLFFAEV